MAKKKTTAKSVKSNKAKKPVKKAASKKITAKKTIGKTIAVKSKPVSKNKFAAFAMKTGDAFKNFVAQTESAPGYRRPLAFGICYTVRGMKNPDKILTCYFPVVNWNENFGSAAVFLAAAGLVDSKGLSAAITSKTSEFSCAIDSDFIAKAYAIFTPYMDEAFGDKHKNVQVVKTLQQLASDFPEILDNYRLVFLFDDAEPQSVPSIYLKLLAMSHNKATPRSLNLTGIFGKLENLAWTDEQPMELEYLRDHEIELKLTGQFPAIDYVDKFPRYLMHVIPADNTRVMDSSRVRLGAHLAGGTTVMPGASYINFNAGTLGPTMVEGRISSSATVGAGSDVGGGASIMGVLSGGNSTPISVGERCLLGANSVTGIPLGDGCIVDAGIAILAGTKIAISGKELSKLSEANPGKNMKSLATSHDGSTDSYIFKASSLAGFNGLHFRQDSTTGRMLATRSARTIELNKDLHTAKKASAA